MIKIEIFINGPPGIMRDRQMTFGIQLALVLALYFYLCTKLQATTLLINLGLPLNQILLAYIFYLCYMYHCPCVHKLGAAQDEDPFMIRLDKGVVVFESLSSARLRIRRYEDVKMEKSFVEFSPNFIRKAFDFGVSYDSTRPRSRRQPMQQRNGSLMYGLTQWFIGDIFLLIFGPMFILAMHCR